MSEPISTPSRHFSLDVLTVLIEYVFNIRMTPYTLMFKTLLSFGVANLQYQTSCNTEITPVCTRTSSFQQELMKGQNEILYVCNLVLSCES